MAESNINKNTFRTANLMKESEEVALYIVATPIGNMEDITLRAIRILGAVDMIASEDTRVTGILLSKLGIKAKKTMCYNDHSGEKERQKIAALLTEGKSVALVSDAGTPLISDPGYKLVRELSEQGFKITSIPGASSVMMALTLSGLPTDRFLFEGFLPPKSQARKNALSELKNIKATLVFFESPKRLVDSLKDMQEVLRGREAAVLREITKKFEEVKRESLSALIEYYTQTPPKGEVVVVVGPPARNSFSEADIEEELKKALRTMSVKDAVALVAENTGANKKDVYKLALGMS
jgi:16S rRNA (cytidine1402-2'-O)-methyltransferase